MKISRRNLLSLFQKWLDERTSVVAIYTGRTVSARTTGHVVRIADEITFAASKFGKSYPDNHISILTNDLMLADYAEVKDFREMTEDSRKEFSARFGDYFVRVTLHDGSVLKVIAREA